MISERLRVGAEATVVLDDRGTESAAEKWEGGLSSTAILLLLSPEAVPPRVSRVEWGALLDHVTGQAGPPVGSLLVRDCPHPAILERSRRFFRWETGPREAMREIEKWILGLHHVPERRSFVPARLPWFEGRQEDLGSLWESLVDHAGTAVVTGPPAAGKTSLAQEFSRQASPHFRDVVWLDCGDRSPASLVGELAELIEVECDGGTREVLPGLVELAGRHRVLLVLDDFPPNLAVPTGPRGHASVLVATRSTQVEAPGAHLLPLDPGPEFPLTVPDHPDDLRLWRAMAVCRRGGFPVDLAVTIAEVDAAAAPAAVARLIENRLVDPMDNVHQRLRLSALSRTAVGDLLKVERRRHAEAVHQAVQAAAAGPGFDKQYLAEVMPAFRWAAGANWPLAAALGRRAFAVLRRLGRVAEGVELMVALRSAADHRGDETVSDECSWELSWIRGEPYRAASRPPLGGDQLAFDFNV